jgi:RNA polymerase sigma-70 factor (ECF subfamily)
MAMRDDGWLTDQFESNRPRVRSVAYRVLGSYAEADDAVQETWLRLRRTDPDDIVNAGGLLTTVIGRVCLDRLCSRRSVGAALWMVLDLLAPAERVAFVLHDVFAVPFDEIGEILERSPEAARQLASRGRRRLHGSAPPSGVLHPDVVLQPDAAAITMGSLRETHGAYAVASALSGGARGAQLALVDGVAGFVWASAGKLRDVVEFTIVDDRIVAIDVTGDPERISRLDIVTLDG